MICKACGKDVATTVLRYVPDDYTGHIGPGYVTVVPFVVRVVAVCLDCAAASKEKANG